MTPAYLAIAELSLLSRIVHRADIQRPAFLLFLLVLSGIYFSYSPWNAHEWIASANLADVFGAALVIETWLVATAKSGLMDRLLLGMAGLLSGGIFTSAAMFDYRFGVGYRLHLGTEIFFVGFLVGLLLLSWRWNIPVQWHAIVTTAYFAVAAAGPVARYFTTKPTWGPVDQALLFGKLACIIGWWWTYCDYDRAKAITSTIQLHAKVTTMVNSTLLWIFLNIIPPRVPKRRAVDLSKFLKPTDPLR